MNTIPTASTQTESADPGRALALWQVKTLTRLAEMAMEQAEGVHAEIMDPVEPPDAAPDPAAATALITAAGTAFPRIARVVVQIIALQARIARDLYGRSQQPAPAEPAETAAKARLRQRRRQVERIVDQAIIETRPDAQRNCKLRSGLAQLLQEIDPVLDPDVLSRPLGVTAAWLCRELGLEPDWSRWAEEDWAAAEARDKPPGSPYADPPAAKPDTG